MSNQVEGESNYGICSTCDGDEGETASAEIPSDDEHETVVGDGRDICPETPDCQLPDETGINTASCDGSALSEGSVTPTLPVDVQLPEAPVSPSNEGSFTPTTPSAPASPTSDIPYLPEVLEPVQEVPAVDTNASFVDMIYDCLRYTFKPSGGRYISLQLPARRLDQISSLHIGAASTCGGFNQGELSTAALGAASI
ncbi:hypothetical protein BN14_11623 [Rhizoctonia solani AG-1 IB]|uniref:Uncharacterized protein n=1 Tax=Thanatephorus cucumeris (strain AG1-IB / isolate 7/3/14) TaxID=1108050 RepID=M5CH93_THACB|nr:hypothetical protein BN14_11623 [Rhizoctonia solani AG-1 IB]